MCFKENERINDLNQLREHISTLVDMAAEREIPLYELQETFRNTKSSLSARNIDGLKNKLNSEFDIDKLNKLSEALTDTVTAHIKYDDKLISIFRTDDLDNILLKLDSAPSFPTMNTPENFNYEFYKKTELSERLYLYQFSITREVNVRTQLDPNDLREDIAEDYQEVIGIRKIPLRCFDFILIDTDNNRIIKGMDLAKVLGHNDLNIAKNNFDIYLREVYSINLKNYFHVDFFDKIQNFYELPKNGDQGVTELAFMTPAGTAHYETLKGKGIDLRTATYHEKGAEGVRNEKYNGKLLNNDITPYKINMRFYFETPKFIDIFLKSSYRDINVANGSHLYEAYVYGSRSLNDLNFIINKLEQ